jgi:hypothetical protein
MNPHWNEQGDYRVAEVRLTTTVHHCFSNEHLTGTLLFPRLKLLLGKECRKHSKRHEITDGADCLPSYQGLIADDVSWYIRRVTFLEFTEHEPNMLVLKNLAPNWIISVFLVAAIWATLWSIYACSFKTWCVFKFTAWCIFQTTLVVGTQTCILAMNLCPKWWCQVTTMLLNTNVVRLKKDSAKNCKKLFEAIK